MKTQYLKGEDILKVSVDNLRPNRAITTEVKLQVLVGVTKDNKISKITILSFKEQMANHIKFAPAIPKIEAGDTLIFTRPKPSENEKDKVMVLLMINPAWPSYNFVDLETGLVLFAKDIRSKERLETILEEFKAEIVKEVTLIKK